LVFIADLVRALYRAGRNPGVKFMRLSSYGSARESTGLVRLLGDFELDLSGRAVLLVDDIVVPDSRYQTSSSSVAVSTTRMNIGICPSSRRSIKIAKTD